MSRLVSELGADVIDDTPKKPNKINPRKRNYIVGLSCLAAALVGVGMVYYFAVTDWLTDYQNMKYITYGVNIDPDEDGPYAGQITASILKVDYTSNYPTTFLIPEKINGHPITRIDGKAFSGCTRLKKVIMPNTIYSIGANAFINCTSLKEIEFSKNLDYIGNDAFLGTAYQESWKEHDYVLANDILVYVNEDKILENNNATSLVFVESSKSTHINDYPDSMAFSLTSFAPADPSKEEQPTIQKWMEGIFKGFKTLKFVETPDYLETIYPKTFENCSALEKVILNEKTIEIGNNVFADCKALTSIEINSGLRTIGDYVFKNDDKLEIDGLASTVTSIGEGIFQNCKMITDFVLPGDITSIPNYAFAKTNLANFTLEDASKINFIGSFAFTGTKFTEFTFPKGVTSISEGVFQDCTELERAYAYDQSVVNINGKAFANDTKFHSLKTLDNNGNITANCVDDDTIYIPAATKKLNKNDGQQFKKTSVKHVYIPLNASYLGASIFKDCNLLEDVTFQAGSLLRDIGKEAFANCSSLLEFDVPRLVKTIGVGAFLNCTSLTSVNLPDANTWSDADYRVVTQKGTVLPRYYTTIKDQLFSGCTSLTHVFIPDTVTKISNHSFTNCVSLKFLSIPESVQTITSYAFEGCGNVYLAFRANAIPRTIEETNNWNSGVKEYIFGVEELLENDDYVYAVNNDSTTITLVLYKNATPANLTLPSTIDGKNVTGIKENFLRGDQTLESVVLPEHITYVGEGAFEGCPNLVTTNSNGFNYLGTASNQYAALISSDAEASEYLINEAVQCAKASAFNNTNITFIHEDYCYYLASESNDHFALIKADDYSNIVINENTKLVVEKSFADLSSLVSVTIPESVTIIGKSAFKKNSSSFAPYCHHSSQLSTWDYNWNSNSGEVYWSTLGPASIVGNYFGACINLDNTLRLTKCIVPDSVVSIPNEVEVEKGDQKVTMQIKEISSHFMMNNTTTFSVYISSGIQIINENAFVDCPSLVIYCQNASKPSGWDEKWNSGEIKTYWDVTQTQNHATVDGLEFNIEGGKAIVSGHSIVAKTVKIPESVTINGSNYAVEGIGDDAFANSPILSSIFIPASVKNISETAFKTCNSVTVYFAGSVADGFKDNYNRPVYENVDFEKDIYTDADIEYLLNRTTHEAWVTSYVYGAAKAIIPESLTVDGTAYTVTAIKERAFEGCTTLGKITLPSSVTTIEAYAFYGCTELKTYLIIPETVEVIGEWAFGETSKSFEFFIEGSVIPSGWSEGWCNYMVDPDSDDESVETLTYSLGLYVEWEYDENGEPVYIIDDEDLGF